MLGIGSFDIQHPESNMKERPNHRKYIQILRQMSPEERLLKAFGSIDAIREASVDDLAAVPGMTRSAAEQVKVYL